MQDFSHQQYEAWDILNINWCEISSINSIIMKNITNSYNLGVKHWNLKTWVFWKRIILLGSIMSVFIHKFANVQYLQYVIIHQLASCHPKINTLFCTKMSLAEMVSFVKTLKRHRWCWRHDDGHVSQHWERCFGHQRYRPCNVWPRDQMQDAGVIPEETTFQLACEVGENGIL